MNLDLLSVMHSQYENLHDTLLYPFQEQAADVRIYEMEKEVVSFISSNVIDSVDKTCQ